MNFQLNKLATGAIDQTMMVTETVVALGRSAALGTAEVIHLARTPVRNIARTTISINDIAHKGITKLVKVQAKAIERSVEASAARLELAAKAPSVKALVRSQIDLLPHTRERIASDLRKTWTVVTETGAEFGALFNGQKPVTATKSRKPRQATRKPRAKKAAGGRKTAAGKSARRTKVARKKTAQRRKAA